MAHRLGSLVPVNPARVFGPGVGSDLGGGVWQDAFNATPPPAGNTKFMILHFVGVTMNAGDNLEVPIGNGDTDVFTAASGPDFWTRPIKGGTVTIRFLDGGSGTGSARVTEYGRGEGIVNGGIDGGADIATVGGNANGDVFMLDTPYVDPPHFTPGGVCPVGGGRHWANAETLPIGVLRDAARSTGIFVEVSEGKVSSCSAALIAPDLILTAAHCVGSATVIPSGSFTLDYQTDATGNRPVGYNPKFHKLKLLTKIGWPTATTGGGTGPSTPLDYAIIQIETPPGGLGAPPLPIRADLPAIGEEVFLIHHPRGAAKKVSRGPADSGCSVQIIQDNKIFHGGDLDNGSSGSPLFDLMGRIVGVNDWAGGCPSFDVNGNAVGISAQAAAAILVNMASAPPPVTDVDVVLVFDKSGSMSLPGLGGGTKIEQARDAAALFIDLLRSDRTHRAALVTFSTTAATTQALAPIAGNGKVALIGPPPNRNGGSIGAITPDAMTTIGGGLRVGRQLLVTAAGANTPAILLLTDGLQNTPPMIADVEAELGNTHLCVIGFGTEGQLNGPLLTRLARDHGGIYTRANEGLALKKFFVLCFGNLFQTAIASDPFYVFPAGSSSMPPIPFSVCDEESITVVMSWKNNSENLILNVITPNGTTLTEVTPGVFTSSGATWVYFRIELPLNGEREGSWQVQVTRAGGDGELFTPPPAEPFFVTVTAVGGPVMRPVAQRRHYYTGDVINPQVVLRYPGGYQVSDANVTIEVESPTNGTGNILTDTGLGGATVFDGDQVDARSSTLILAEQAHGGTLIGTATNTYPLFDDGVRDGDDALEPNGVFGNPLADILRFEGNYTFHARASYGHGCIGMRETMWSMCVSVGIDPGATKIEIVTTADAGGDGKQLTVRLTPHDRYGNPLGPGRGDQFSVSGATGSTPNAPTRDRGDGSYDVGVRWDPAVAPQPSVVITQPDRPPVTIMPPTVPTLTKAGCPTWLGILLIAVIAVLVILLI